MPETPPTAETLRELHRRLGFTVVDDDPTVTVTFVGPKVAEAICRNATEATPEVATDVALTSTYRNDCQPLVPHHAVGLTRR